MRNSGVIAGCLDRVFSIDLILTVFKIKQRSVINHDYNTPAPGDRTRRAFG
jgi:hypothetical protein